jgi:cytochrome c-type biogenesis protein CcmE
MAQQGERLRRWRAMALIAVLIVGLGLLLTRCPSNRDGMPGQLAQSMDETVAAARSGALALELWIQRRSTDQLTSVQLSDARDEVVKAYKGIADLRADDPVDIERQRMLTESMTTIIAQLNAAAATIRHVSSEPAPEKSRDELQASADELEHGYR